MCPASAWHCSDGFRGSSLMKYALFNLFFMMGGQTEVSELDVLVSIGTRDYVLCLSETAA